MKKIFLIVLFITGVVFAQSAYKGIPGWYKRTPVRKDIVYATGLGNGRIEALIISLDELSSIFETRRESVHDESGSAIKDESTKFETRRESFHVESGSAIKDESTKIETSEWSEWRESSLLDYLSNEKFSLTALFKEFKEYEKDSIVFYKSSHILELSYHTSGASAMINYYKSDDNLSIISRLDALYEGTTEDEIIEELKKLGLTFEFALDNDGHYYAMAGIRKNILDSKN